MAVSRKSFLRGVGCATVGAAAGATLGAFGQRQLMPDTASGPASRPTRLNIPPRGEDSFAQGGEDRIVRFIFQYLGIGNMNYMDIGAYDPVHINNTYLFYRLGARGVLVEPNVAMCRRIRDVRPGDTVLEAGIGVTAAGEADFYVMTDPSWSTFSKEEAERQVQVSEGKTRIQEVIKMPLLDINQVMDEHLKGAPAFLSVDTQGLDLAILKSIDYGRLRPKVICTETLIAGTREIAPETAGFLESRGYVLRGMSFVNSIFVDSRII